MSTKKLPVWQDLLEKSPFSEVDLLGIIRDGFVSTAYSSLSCLIPKGIFIYLFIYLRKINIMKNTDWTKRATRIPVIFVT